MYLSGENRGTAFSDLVQRYLALVPVNRAKKEWGRQTVEGYAQGRFPYQSWPMMDRDIEGHLLGKHWLGSRAPAGGWTDRIAFDLDAKSADQVEDRNRRYGALRQLLGWGRIPLVYRTPSGFGLRVVYRIPRVRLEDLATAQTRGLVADVLRGAGFDVADGEIEVYPQKTRIDRLPLGRRMPILDPETLEPVVPIDDGFSLDALEAGIAALEAWYAHPHPDLLGHLRLLPRVEQHSRKIQTSAATAPEMPAVSLVGGLTGPGQRRRAEWLVGREILRDPAAYGLPDDPTNEQVAGAIAGWLAAHNHGHSQDWNARLRECGGDAEEVARQFAADYLMPNSDGRHMIDRRRTAPDDPMRRRCIGVSLAEFKAIAHLADQHYTGAKRYRFEVWTVAFLLYVREQAYADSCGARSRSISPDEEIFEIAKSVMQSWPYGGGRDGNRPRYRQYLDHLCNADWLWLRREARTRGYGAKRNTGRLWAVPTKICSPITCIADVGVDPKALRRAAKEHGVPFAELLHLHLALSAFPARAERVARYGKRAAERMAKLSRLLPVYEPAGGVQAAAGRTISPQGHLTPAFTS